MGVPGSANMLLAAGEAAAYEIDQSLRFVHENSHYLSRTSPSTAATDGKIFTISVWVKYFPNNENGGYGQRVIAGSSAGNTYHWMFGTQGGASGINDGNRISVNAYPGSPSSFYTNLDQYPIRDMLRDCTAWMHLVMRWDTSQATSSNRVKVWINNQEYAGWTGTVAYPAQNSIPPWSETTSRSLYIGYNNYFNGVPNYFDGYMAEFYNVDGQALSPTDFGEYNADGAWVPKAYGGTYGNYGFYLKFDPSASNGIGHDHSGNGNHWTANNFTTSGTGTDVLNDSPTNNHLTFNEVGSLMRGGGTFYEAGLKVGSWSSNYSWARGSMSVRSDDSAGWYCEVTQDNDGAYNFVAMWDQDYGKEWDTNQGNSIGINTAASVGISFGNTGELNNYGSYVGNYGSWRSNGDVIMIAVKANKVWFGKNGTWYSSGNPSTGANPQITLSSNKNFTFAVGGFNSSARMSINAGIKSYVYTVPTGFKQVCSANLPDPAIANAGEYFNALTYTGNGSNNHAITGVGFQPNLAWIKSRTVNGHDHCLVDSVVGTSSVRRTNVTNADYTQTDAITSFDSDGFTLGDDNSVGQAGNFNTNGYERMALLWKEGSLPGCDIVTYTSGNTKPKNVAHSLGVKPDSIWIFNRTAAASKAVYHSGIGATKALFFNSVSQPSTASDWFNNTEPTSTQFTVFDSTSTHAYGSTHNYVAYCFASVPGFSKFGVYAGNGQNNGVYVDLGFRPALLIVKRTDGSNTWTMWDKGRSFYGSFNEKYYSLIPSGADQEQGNEACDFLANGFKMRRTPSYYNGNTNDYVYWAWAESPFKFSLAR